MLNVISVLPFIILRPVLGLSNSTRLTRREPFQAARGRGELVARNTFSVSHRRSRLLPTRCVSSLDCAAG